MDERLEYDQAVGVVRDLTEIRFKLLALVPTLAGTVVALLPPHAPAVALIAIGLLGLVASTGILVYELRNTQVRAAAAARVTAYEARTFPGGPLGVAPTRIAGVALGHRLGLALVYGTALAAWAYIVAWGILRAAAVSHARPTGLGVGVVAGIAVGVAVVRFESRMTATPAGAATVV